MTINEIMDSIKSNETLIIPIVKDDILLSLTCNQVETTHFYERIKKSLDLIQQAKEVFMKRMEVAQ